MSAHNGRPAARRPRGLVCLCLKLLTLALVPFLWTSQALASDTALNRRVTFHIPAQPLDSALLLFGKQAGLAVSVPGRALHAIEAHSLSGTFPARDALSDLLDSSGWNYEAVGTTVTIVPRANSAASSAGFVASNGGEAASEAENGSLLAAPSDVGESAESAEDPDTSKHVGLVVVTGSHIRNDAGTIPASPVVEITRDDIDRSGYTSTPELISSLPQNYGGGAPQVTYNPSYGSEFSSYTGTTTPSLRGLGAATLVLLDGHRLPKTGGTNSSDISGIPLAAIDHVDVVADGASAVYGSDAVAGVMNFVLKQDYQGLELDAASTQPTRDGGGLQQDYSVMGGKSWGTGNGILSCSLHKLNELHASDRDFSHASPIDNTLLPGTKTESCTGILKQRMTDDLSLTVDSIFAHRDAEGMFGPYFGSLYPSMLTATQFSLSTGLLYSTGDWQVRLYGDAGQDREHSRGYLVTTTSQRLTSNSTGQDRDYSIEMNADGPLATLPSGIAKAALGGGYRREEFSLAVPLTPTSSNSSAREVAYAYGEIQVPLVFEDSHRYGLEALAASGSVRYDHYSDFGSTTNPKFGLVYKPLQEVQLRATWGKSFRAPELIDLRSPETSSLELGLLSGVKIPVLYRSGGNPSLGTESSTSWTTTADFLPASVPGLRISASYFHYEFRDKIVLPVTVPLATVSLTDPRLSPFTILTPSRELVDDIAANSIFANYAGPGYSLANVEAIVDDRFTNVSTWVADGADFGLNDTFETPIGQLDLSFNGTRLNLATQPIPTVASLALTGVIFNPPKFRFRTGAALVHGRWTGSAFLNYVGGSHTLDTQPQSVGSFVTIDAIVSYQFHTTLHATGIRATFGALNLMDRNPPRVPTSTTITSPLYDGYDAANASPLGRELTARLAIEW